MIARQQREPKRESPREKTRQREPYSEREPSKRTLESRERTLGKEP